MKNEFEKSKFVWDYFTGAVSDNRSSLALQGTTYVSSFRRHNFFGRFVHLRFRKCMEDNFDLCHLIKNLIMTYLLTCFDIHCLLHVVKQFLGFSAKKYSQETWRNFLIWSSVAWGPQKVFSKITFFLKIYFFCFWGP